MKSNRAQRGKSQRESGGDHSKGDGHVNNRPVGTMTDRDHPKNLDDNNLERDYDDHQDDFDIGANRDVEEQGDGYDNSFDED